MSKKKKNLNTYITPFIKVNSKGTTDLNAKGKTIKLLEDNIGENTAEMTSGLVITF